MDCIINRDKVVCKFNRNEDRCNSTYYEYTANSQIMHCSQQWCKDSILYQHYVIDHAMLPPKLKTFTFQFEIVYSNPNQV